MTESNETPGHRRTVWVTIAGGLFLAFGIWHTVNALSFGDEFISNAAKTEFDVPVFQFVQGLSLAIGLIFAYGGLATLGRWRGWRVWYGALAWGTIVTMGFSLVPLMHLSRSGEPTPKDVLTFFLVLAFVVVGIAVLALIAKRAERPPA